MAERYETREAAFYKRHPIVATVIAGLIVALITGAITYILPKEAERTNNSQVETIASETLNTIPNSDMAIEAEEGYHSFGLKEFLIASLLGGCFTAVLLFLTYIIFKQFCDEELAMKIAGVISVIIPIGILIWDPGINQLVYKLSDLF